VSLSEIDRNLLKRCLAREARAWEDFVDRFMGLVIHVTNHSAQCRSIRLSAEQREELCSEVFLAIVNHDFGVLRRFRGQCSLATYLTVVARRVVVREMVQRKGEFRLAQAAMPQVATVGAESDPSVEQRATDRDEVERLIQRLDDNEAEVVRMFHLQGMTYQQISDKVGMPENTVGPTLSRAREKMRRAGVDPAPS